MSVIIFFGWTQYWILNRSPELNRKAILLSNHFKVWYAANKLFAIRLGPPKRKKHKKTTASGGFTCC